MERRCGVLVLAAVVVSLATPAAVPAGRVAIPEASNPNAYWTQYGYDAGRTGFNRMETTLGAGNVASLVRAWTAPLGVTTYGESSPMVTSGVYVGTSSGTMKLTLAGGKPIWTKPRVVTVTASAAQGRILIGFLKAVSPVNGHFLWSVSPGGQSADAPTVDGSLAFIHSDHNQATAIDVTTGAIVWQLFHYGLSDAVAGEGRVYMDLGGEGAAAFDEATGTRLWLVHRGAGSIPVYASGRVFYDCRKALDAATGTLLWDDSALYPFLAAQMAVARGVAYCGGSDNALHALDAKSGNLLWTAPLGPTPFGQTGKPAVANGVVYVPGSDGVVYALDAYTGAILWQAAVGGPVEAVVVSHGALYASDNTGTLYAWRLPT